MGFFLPVPLSFIFSFPYLSFSLIVEKISYQTAQKCLSVGRVTPSKKEAVSGSGISPDRWFIPQRFLGTFPRVWPSGEWINAPLCWTLHQTQHFSPVGIFSFLLCDGVFKPYIRGTSICGKVDWEVGRVLRSALGRGKQPETAAVIIVTISLCVCSSGCTDVTKIQHTR